MATSNTNRFPSIPQPGPYSWIDQNGAPTLAFVSYMAQLKAWADKIQTNPTAYGSVTGLIDRGSFDTAAAGINEIRWTLGAIYTDLKAKGILA